jgi:hypothetical protein
MRYVCLSCAQALTSSTTIVAATVTAGGTRCRRLCIQLQSLARRRGTLGKVCEHHQLCSQHSSGCARQSHRCSHVTMGQQRSRTVAVSALHCVCVKRLRALERRLKTTARDVSRGQRRSHCTAVWTCEGGRLLLAAS